MISHTQASAADRVAGEKLDSLTRAPPPLEPTENTPVLWRGCTENCMALLHSTDMQIVQSLLVAKKVIHLREQNSLLFFNT